jgi:GxxExxY protein
MGLIEERRTRSIIGAFYEVYNTLGFGFLEKVYQNALERELCTRGHVVEREVQARVAYKGGEIARQRLDMVVDDRVIVEIKSALLLHPSAVRQVLSYLKATAYDVGLLLHFGPKPAFHRLDGHDNINTAFENALRLLVFLHE